MEKRSSTHHNPPSLTLESQVRLFSFSLQTLDIYGTNTYIESRDNKNKSNLSFPPRGDIVIHHYEKKN